MDAMAWSLIETERLTLADLLESLTPEQWCTPSLCVEWRIRDVAAHVAMTPAGAPSVGTMVRALATNRGRLWSAGRDVAVAYAERSTAELAGELRRDAAARTKPVFVVASNILLDLVVHGQDIAVPLQIARPVPSTAGRLSLSRIWSMGWPFHARRRLDGVRVCATDCDWSAGSGPDITGTAAELLLLMTSRDGAIDSLQGRGVDLIRPRFTTQRVNPKSGKGAQP